MAELVSNCPRCGAKRITFDIRGAIATTRVDHGWKCYYEAFSVCRECKRSTIFVVGDRKVETGKIVRSNGGVHNIAGSVSEFVAVEGYINESDFESVAPPEHLPADIQRAFIEGAKCLAIGCYNAAATMFRLCIDLASKEKLPQADDNGLNARIRRNLGLRLPWLFDNQLLPEALRDLSHCVKEDGNDGAHAGTLSKEDAADLLDFAVALLERLYTEPERLKLAQSRRDLRRVAT